MTFLAGLLMFLPLLQAHAVPPAPTVLPSMSPKVTVDVAKPEPGPMTPDEKRKLPLEFKRALNDEERSMDHQEKAAMKELSASQNAQLKIWRSAQKKERQTFFEQHESGPERRAHVQTYLGRKKAFDQGQKDEMVSAKQSWKEKHERLKQSQKDREAQFKSELEQGKRPKTELWPHAH